MQINYPRLLDDLRRLAQFGQVGSGVHRLSFTPEDQEARHWLLQKMTEAGLDAQIDGIGNVYGQTNGVDKAVLIGSHTDSVPKGGWLDGAM
ncbi:MAG TPA: Zn-dependent hydrolase, partial [Candidatus Tectomicrobia bacterium]